MSEPPREGSAEGSRGPRRPVTPHTLPAPLREFAERWNRGEFWECHEVLEEPWRDGGSEFYHGLILLASGFVHLQRDNPHGIAAQLEKALQALDPFRPHYLGIELDALLETAEQARRAVVERRDARPPRRWSDVVEPPPIELEPTLVRGDEPELAGPRTGQKRRKRM